MAETDNDHIIRKLESLEQRLQKQALETSEGLSALKSLIEENKRIAKHAESQVEDVTSWMNGKSETGGAKVRLALLEEREKRRDFWTKTAVGMGTSGVIAVLGIFLKALIFGTSQ